MQIIHELCQINHRADWGRNLRSSTANCICLFIPVLLAYYSYLPCLHLALLILFYSVFIASSFQSEKTFSFTIFDSSIYCFSSSYYLFLNIFSSLIFLIRLWNANKQLLQELFLFIFFNDNFLLIYLLRFKSCQIDVFQDTSKCLINSIFWLQTS